MFGMQASKSPWWEGHPTAQQLAQFEIREEFNQSLDGIHLLSSLHSLMFGCDFNQSLKGIQLPSSWRSLTFATSSTRVWMHSSSQHPAEVDAWL